MFGWFPRNRLQSNRVPFQAVICSLISLSSHQSTDDSMLRRCPWKGVRCRSVLESHRYRWRLAAAIGLSGAIALAPPRPATLAHVPAAAAAQLLRAPLAIPSLPSTGGLTIWQQASWCECARAATPCHCFCRFSTRLCPPRRDCHISGRVVPPPNPILPARLTKTPSNAAQAVSDAPRASAPLRRLPPC